MWFLARRLQKLVRKVYREKTISSSCFFFAALHCVTSNCEFVCPGPFVTSYLLFIWFAWFLVARILTESEDRNVGGRVRMCGRVRTNLSFIGRKLRKITRKTRQSGEPSSGVCFGHHPSAIAASSAVHANKLRL